MAKKSAYLRKLKLEKQIYAEVTKQMSVDAAMKLAFIAMNDVLGVGKDRALRFWAHYNKLNEEFAELSRDDYEGALGKLDERITQIIGEGTVLEVKVGV